MLAGQGSSAWPVAAGPRWQLGATERCRVLFVGGKNRLRSPTAEIVFADWPGVETASAGTWRDADTPLTAELVDWAELIFVMGRRQRSALKTKFLRFLRDKRVVCLDIPDRYELMDPELVALLTARVVRHLPERPG